MGCCPSTSVVMFLSSVLWMRNGVSASDSSLRFSDGDCMFPKNIFGGDGFLRIRNRWRTAMAR